MGLSQHLRAGSGTPPIHAIPLQAGIRRRTGHGVGLPVPDACQHGEGAGFTLIEMLAVLTLVGLMSAVTLPAMQRWFDSVSQRAQVSEIAVQFQKLGARAALLAQTVEVGKSTWRDRLADGEPALALPEGWAVAGDGVVKYYQSGVCGGGSIELSGPQEKSVRLQIAPVSCDVSLQR